MPKSTKVFIRTADGGYLFRFDMGWYTQCGDDPTTWTNDRKKAKRYTPERAADIIGTVCNWHAAHIEAVQP